MSDQKAKTWEALQLAAEDVISREPLLEAYLRTIVLDADSFEVSVATLLDSKLQYLYFKRDLLKDIFAETLVENSEILTALCADLKAICTRDPACDHILTPYMYFKGFHALQGYRLSNALWKKGRKEIALSIQSRISRVFSVDIHPAATIGKGILMDHATGIVIGETAVIDDNVSMLHEVTLGGTGKEIGDRHPKIRSCVLIGAGAKILGNIVVGEGSRVGAGSVVLEDVPAHCTVAGVPAVVVGKCSSEHPSLDMDHCLSRKGE